MNSIEFGITNRCVNRWVFFYLLSRQDQHEFWSYFLNLDGSQINCKKISDPSQMKSLKYFQTSQKRSKTFKNVIAWFVIARLWMDITSMYNFLPINWPVGESYEESGPWLEAMDGYIKVVNKQRVNLFCYSLVAYKRSLVG